MTLLAAVALANGQEYAPSGGGEVAASGPQRPPYPTLVPPYQWPGPQTDAAQVGAGGELAPFAAGPHLPPPSPYAQWQQPQTQVTPTGYPAALFDPPLDASQFMPEAEHPPGAKDGPLQRVAMTGAWLPRGNSGFGMTDVSWEATVAFPMPTPDSPLLWTPAFELHYLDGPTVPDLPARLYDASLQIRWLSQLTPSFGVDLAVTPGWHGDFELTEGDAIRIPARALGVWDCGPQCKLVVGALFLDREDVTWLPAGGVIWTPNEDVRLEAVFPRPRLAWRIYNDGCEEHWSYLAGEFGGGSYSIRRASGQFDVVTLSDLRLIYGLECKRSGGLGFLLEVAYVFAREVDYESATPDIEPGDTAMVRCGVFY